MSGSFLSYAAVALAGVALGALLMLESLLGPLGTYRAAVVLAPGALLALAAVL